MDWYYAEGGNQVGPLSEAEFEQLFGAGKITAETLVWRSGQKDWQPLHEVQPERFKKPPSDNQEPGSSEPQAGDPPGDESAVEEQVSEGSGELVSATVGSVSEATVTGEPSHGDAICSECRNLFTKSDMIRHGDQWICAACKPVFLQKLKEGVPLAGEFEYGGFWIRFGAKLLDGIVIWVLQMMIMGLIGLVVGLKSVAAQAVAQVFQLAIAVAYTTYFLGRFSATPGKMACKLKVIRPDGEPISYARACGRHFAEALSALILLIGYIMAGFDDQKRTLHDRICDTRVVKQ